ncbi:MAG: OmpA family protein [Bacteroidetes bacterium]|nr:OmpA family protein [Bacteroidota bacterium]
MKSLALLVIFTCTFLTIHAQEKKFSLYYDNDQHQLTAAHQTLLDSLKRLPNKDSLDVHIKGYTNSIGATEYNLELSRKRAEYVKEELRAFTIISTKGFGELKGAHANNRRVDVFVHLKRDHIAIVGEIIEAPIEELTEVSVARIDLENPKKGDKITLEGIFFYENRDVIRDESKDALNALVKYLKKNPDVKFKLIGHICCGDPMKPYKDHKNLRTGKDNLSEARAQALHNYLAKQGIAQRRMRYFGMAFRQSTGKGDEFDRRVEIEITSTD